jgi:hypothetical protein
MVARRNTEENERQQDTEDGFQQMVAKELFRAYLSRAVLRQVMMPRAR